jgi:putative membrane protein
MKRTALAAAVVLSAPLMLAAAPAFAAAAPSTEQFVNNVAISDMFEVQAGRLAADKAQLDAVQAFGKRMVDDHSKTTEQLKSLVSDNDIKAELPTALDDKHQSKLDKLKDLSGTQFDKTYIDGQVQGHEKAVDMFQAYSESGDNPKLKQWAQTTLPTLKDHLKQAQTLQQEVDKAPATAANDNDTMAADQMAADKRDTAKHDMMADKTADTDRTANADKVKAPAPSKIDYVTRQEPTDWSAQALIGKSVKNMQDETLGDINNVVLNEKGDVVAVTIGVGGFLGLGEKDVGVPFDALKFRTAAEVESQAGTDNATKEERAEEKREARNDTEHEDMVIVLNATREQLENAPSFVWLDQQTANDKRSERSVE